MLDPRIYRAALLPVLLVLIVVAFSLEDGPAPLGTALAPVAFDGARAARLLDDLAARFPDRRPGSRGDAALAGRVARELRAALPAVSVHTRSFSAQTIDGRRELQTVWAEQPGSGAGAQLVVVAHRDAAAAGAKAELSGTAALLELARVLGSARPARTVTFASVSGGSGGQAGMADLVAHLQRPVDALVELGDLAGPLARRPLVVTWSQSAGTAPLQLTRTVAAALRQETGIVSRDPPALTALARFAFPLSVSGQGVADEAAVPAVRLSASGELPPAADAPALPARLDGFGRSALRALTALDGGRQIGAAPSRDLLIARKLLPGWALRLLVLALLVPPLVTLVDAVARMRRRGEPLARRLGWVLALAVPVALAALFARALGLTHAVVALSPPAPPGIVPVHGSGWAAMTCALVVLVLGFLAARPALVRALRAGPAREDPAAGLAAALVASVSGLVAWAVNPYAALLLVLPANLWLLIAAREVRLRRPVAVLVVLSSLLPIAGVLIAYAGQLDMGVGNWAWFWFLTLAGGQGGAAAMLGWCVVAGAATAALLVALLPDADAADLPVTVRGPRTYAGPGSLGGTDSALHR
jgi:hypothetical protein